MQKFGWRNAMVGLTCGAVAWALTGCEHGGGGGGGGNLGDIGSNDPNVYVTLGDSITDGNNGGGAPYPPRLATITGKTVINRATQGGSTEDALGEIGGILTDLKPAAVLFMVGSIDVIEGQNVDTSIGDLRSIIEQCKANHTVPVMSTLTPVLYSHIRFQSGIDRLNSAIRDLASSEGVRLVDMASKFGDGTKYLLPDGLHPNEEGNQVMAEAFADAL